jgi:hypothetical protein
MATRNLILPTTGVVIPDGSDSNNAFPQPRRRKSTSGANRPYYLEWLFDAALSEYLIWQFIIPADYVSGGSVIGKFAMVSATSGNVMWEAAILPVVDASTLLSSADFNSRSQGLTAVPGTLHQTAGFTIALATLTNVVGGRLALVFLARNGVSASDTAAGDAILEGATFQYTA